MLLRNAVNLVVSYEGRSRALRSDAAFTSNTQLITKEGVLGSCGFQALGISRADMLRNFEGHFEDDIVRSYVANDIMNDLHSGEETNLSEVYVRELKILLRHYEIMQQIRNQLIFTYAAIFPDLAEPGEDDLLNALDEAEDIPVKEQMIDKLRWIKASLAEAEQSLLDRLSLPIIVEEYLRKNIERGWLGSHVMCAWAHITGVKLRIWTHRNLADGSSDLYARFVIHSDLEGEWIDVLHTSGQRHFERLRTDEGSPIVRQEEAVKLSMRDGV